MNERDSTQEQIEKLQGTCMILEFAICTLAKLAVVSFGGRIRGEFLGSINDYALAITKRYGFEAKPAVKTGIDETVIYITKQIGTDT